MAIQSVDLNDDEIQSPVISGTIEALSKIQSIATPIILQAIDEPMLKCSTEDNSKGRIYQVSNGKRNWINTIIPTIKINGIAVDSATGGYEIDYIGGSISFLASYERPLTDTIMASFSYESNYSMPIASNIKTGGFRADEKTSAETQEVKVDYNTGKAYVKSGDIPKGNLTESTSNVLTINNGDESVLKNVSIEIKLASLVQDGYLSAQDYETLMTKKADLVDGTVPSSQLPSYVDDVIEKPTFDDFPTIGEQGKIYIAIDTNYQYRWTGTNYIKLPAQLDYATQAEAESGTENTKVMTSLRVLQSITKNVPNATSIVKGISFLGASGGAATYDDFENYQNSSAGYNWLQNPLKPSVSISQRGTTVTSTGSPIYGSLDREKLNAPSGHLTLSQEVDGAAKITVNGITTGGMAYQILEYIKEFFGESITLSYEIWTDTPVILQIYINNVVAMEKLIQANNQYERYDITIAELPNTFSSLYASIYIPNGTIGGKTARYRKRTMQKSKIYVPPLERDFSEELIKCQRYFEKSYNIDVSPGTVNAVGETNYVFPVQLRADLLPGFAFKISKRTSPFVQIISAAGNLNKVTSVMGTEPLSNVAATVGTSQNGVLVIKMSAADLVSNYNYYYHYTSDADM